MGMKQYRVAYQLIVTGEIDVMAADEDTAVDELDYLDLSDLVEQRKNYEVYNLEEPEEVK